MSVKGQTVLALGLRPGAGRGQCYDLPMQELQNFRQLHSKTAGHPEVGITPAWKPPPARWARGITNAVGMALAESCWPPSSTAGHTIVDHHTYAFLGDGCLMEGISHEACALAGAWKLNKLVALYDDNGISIDGQVAALVHRRHGAALCRLWLERDRPAVDGHDAAVERRHRRREEGMRETERPRSIICKTHIGKGSPQPRQHRQGTARRAAGAEKSSSPARRWLDQRALRHPGRHRRRLGRLRASRRAAWERRFAAYRPHPELAAEFTRRMPASCRRTLPRRRWTPRWRAHQGRDRGQPQGQPAGAGSLHRRAARVAGRQRRPDRLQPHQHQSTPNLR